MSSSIMRILIEMFIITVVAFIIIALLFNPNTGYGMKLTRMVTDFFTENLPIAEGGFAKGTSISKSFGNIENAFAIAKQSPDKRCFVRLKPLSPDFDEYLLTLTQTGNGLTMSLSEDKSEGVPLSHIEIKDIFPCAVAGSASEVFYNSWIMGLSNQGREYLEYNNIRIKDREKIFLDGDRSSYEVNYLYKADDKHVCFIPTYDPFWGSDDCKFDVEGLSSACVGKLVNLPECKR